MSKDLRIAVGDMKRDELTFYDQELLPVSIKLLGRRKWWIKSHREIERQTAFLAGMYAGMRRARYLAKGVLDGQGDEKQAD